MSAVKKVIISICRPICRLVACILWQIPWFGVCTGGIWWLKHILPNAINQHFGVTQASENLTIASEYVKALKDITSFTNPTSFISYFSALLDRASASAKYTYLNLIAKTSEAFLTWTLNIVFVFVCIYAICRIYKAFRADTKTYVLTKNIVNQISPGIAALQEQVTALQQEMLELKNELRAQK